jgi:V8-like Glu-specific endopeptidase
MLTITHLTGFGRGKSKTYSGPNVILGTDPSCDVRFDPTWDKEVSPRHAQITIQNGECWIDDLGSSTGVWVGGKKIVREELNGSVEISLGQNGQRLKIDVPVMVKQASVPVAAHQAHAHVSNSKSSSKAVPIVIGLAAALAVGFVFIKQRINIGGNDVTISIGSKADKTAAKEGATPATPQVEPVAPAPTTPEKGSAVSLVDSDEKLRLAAKKYEQAVGLVVEAVSGRGDPGATAWAVAPYTFATNAHVTEGIEPLIKSGGSAFVVINKNPDLRFRVKKAITHPKYYSREKMGQGVPPELNIDGKEASVGAYDVGLLIVDGDPPVKFPLASKEKLSGLDSGTRVAYLGFPMENLRGSNVDMHQPVATMQSGIITSVTDEWMSKASISNAILIHHNLPSAGGASGSPVFDTDGEVIGLHSAGNYTMGFNWETGNSLRVKSRNAQANLAGDAIRDKMIALLADPKLTSLQRDAMLVELQRQLLLAVGNPASDLTRVTSASLINFAQRVDLLKQLLEAVPAQ